MDKIEKGRWIWIAIAIGIFVGVVVVPHISNEMRIQKEQQDEEQAKLEQYEQGLSYIRTAEYRKAANEFDKLDDYQESYTLYHYSMGLYYFQYVEDKIQCASDLWHYMRFISSSYQGIYADEIKSLKETSESAYKEYLVWQEEETKLEAERKIEAERIDNEKRLFVPYEGMEEKLIDETKMGIHDGVKTVDEHYDKATGKTIEAYHQYTWKAKSGDTILKVVCKNQKVDSVERCFPATYWNLKYHPDLYAKRYSSHYASNGKTSTSSSKSNSSSKASSSKKSSSSSSKKYDPYDVYSYDDPEDFYFDYDDDFDEFGDAEDYWDDAWGD